MSVDKRHQSRESPQSACHGRAQEACAKLMNHKQQARLRRNRADLVQSVGYPVILIERGSDADQYKDHKHTDQGLVKILSELIE